jgi:hypothetical protein
MPFQPGNTEWAKGNPKKPYRAALRIEAAIHENGGRLPKVRKGSLRDLARQALMRARHNTAALEHVANRLDGPVIPAPDDPPSQQIVEIRVVVVDPANTIDAKPIENMPAIDANPSNTIDAQPRGSAEFADVFSGNESEVTTGEKPNQDAANSQSSTCPEAPGVGEDVGTDQD